MSVVVLPIKTCSYWAFVAAMMADELAMLTIGYRLVVLPSIAREASGFLALAVSQQPDPDSVIARAAATDAIWDLFGTDLSQEKVGRILDECQKLLAFLQGDGVLADFQLSTKQILHHIFKFVRDRGEAEMHACVVSDLPF